MSADRQYGREDVSYDTWYNPWMKQLAAHYTRSELEAQLHGTRRESRKAGEAHERAIKRTSSMQSNSQRRAHTRNVAAAVGDRAIALSGAIEIHDLFPEHAKKELDSSKA